ncbi:MAG: hypothetical protein FWC58_03755 [Desulfobulbus sp.]|nr:hypothetical protein [Desulfobulbus sp.]
MNAYILLFAELAASVGLSLAVLWALSRPLVNVLRLVCPDEQAAVFWLSYTRVMLTITPLLFVLIVSVFSRFDNPLGDMRLALIAALAGLVLGLWSIGKRIEPFTTQDGQTMEAP